MATRTLILDQTMLLDPAGQAGEGWNLSMPAGAVSGSYVELITVTADLTPINLDFGTQQFMGSVPSGPLPLVFPDATARLLFDPDSNSWWVQTVLEPQPPALDLDGSAFVIGSLGATWVDLQFGLSATYQKYMTYTSPYDFGFLIPGVYEFRGTGSMAHDSSNQGREFLLRFWNQTDGVTFGEGVSYWTGRNADGSQWAFGGMIDLPPALIGKQFRLQIAAQVGSSYSIVEIDMNNLTWSGFDISVAQQAALAGI